MTFTTDLRKATTQQLVSFKHQLIDIYNDMENSNPFKDDIEIAINSINEELEIRDFSISEYH